MKIEATHCDLCGLSVSPMTTAAIRIDGARGDSGHYITSHVPEACQPCRQRVRDFLVGLVDTDVWADLEKLGHRRDATP